MQLANATTSSGDPKRGTKGSWFDSKSPIRLNTTGFRVAIRINRNELLRVLGAVSPGLSPKDIVEQSACFAFRNGWVMTFNDEVSARIKTGLPKEFVGAVHADSFFKVLTKLPEEEVELEPDGGELRVRGKRRRAGIRMEADIVLPIEHVERPTEWTELPENFLEAVRIVQESAGRNEEEFVTVCVNIAPRWIEACDRMQATRYKIRTGVEKPFLVRAVALKHITSTEMTEIAETESWVHFRNPSGLILSCRRYNEEFPDLAPALDYQGEAAVLPKGLTEAADLASIFTGEDKDSDYVSVELSEGRLRVRGEGSKGWASSDVKLAYHGRALAFRVSPKLLVELVNKHNECELGPDKLKVTGERWVYVTGLIPPEGGGAADEPEPEREEASVPAPETADDENPF